MKRYVKPTMIFIVVGLCLCAVYFFVNPATSYLMPKCIFKMLTGYDCPSCGSQRVFHMLLHGNISSAFFLNPFLFIVTPYLLAVVYSSISKSRFAIWLKPYVNHYITISVYLVIYVLWWVVRNTEWWKSLLS